jgi:hypothetical protein
MWIKGKLYYIKKDVKLYRNSKGKQTTDDLFGAIPKKMNMVCGRIV